MGGGTHRVYELVYVLLLGLLRLGEGVTKTEDEYSYLYLVPSMLNTSTAVLFVRDTSYQATRY